MDDREWRSAIIPLHFTWQPTAEELDRLRQLVSHATEQRATVQIDRTGPSMIVDPFLYQADVKQASNKILLEELGIQSILNVSECQLDGEITAQRHVLWLNIDDDTYTDIAQHFEMTNAFLHDCQAKQRNVLVHCQMGVSRSSTIVLAYLLKHQQYSLQQAYEHLIQRRPMAEPNLAFLLQLMRYEKESKEIPSVRQDLQKKSPETPRRSSKKLCCFPFQFS